MGASSRCWSGMSSVVRTRTRSLPARTSNVAKRVRSRISDAIRCDLTPRKPRARGCQRTTSARAKKHDHRHYCERWCRAHERIWRQKGADRARSDHDDSEPLNLLTTQVWCPPSIPKDSTNHNKTSLVSSTRGWYRYSTRRSRGARVLRRATRVSREPTAHPAPGETSSACLP